MILRNRQLLIDYKVVFESPEGTRVLADLRKKCPQLTSAAHLQGALDPHRLLVQEGQRSVLTYIYQMLRRDPNAETPDQAVNRNKGE